MPEADVFEAPQNATFHGELLETLTEAFVGNGVLADGEAEVTADGGTAMGIDVSAAANGVRYGGTIYTPAADSFTLSTGPTTTTGGQDDNRVDLVYFDTGTSSYAVSEGTADPNPVPPSTPSDGILLALVEVAHDATDISDGNILNWRARPQGGSFDGSGEASFDTGLRVGPNPTTTITETSSPTGFTFSASEGVDVWLETAVDLSNNSGASATEDITLTLYDGTSNGDPQVATDTNSSVTIADGASTTETLLPTDQQLDDGDYYVEVTTSGTDISVDEVRVSTQGLEWSFVETADGTFDFVNRYTGNSIFTVDAFSDEIAFLNAAIDEPEIADGSITTAKIADDAVTLAKIAANAVDNEQLVDDAVTDVEIGTLASGFTGSTNAGSFGALFDFPVDSGATDGTLQSYTFAIDGTDLIQFRALSDGAGGVDTLEVRLLQSLNVNGNDIEDGATTVWSSSDGWVPRTSVDDQIVRSSTKTTAYTTADEELIPVDTTGGAVTITLASADVSSGNEIIIKDVGGTASTNNITVATEGSETIDANGSITIDVDYGSIVVVGDGTNWDLERGVSRNADPRNIFEGTETGAVANGDQGILTVDSLADGETVDIFKAALTTDTIEAIPTGVDLELVTFDNAGSYTSRATLITGDGSTIHDRETGNPLASYTNSSGGDQSIGVLVDNGSGASIDIVAKVEGTAPA